MDGAIAVTLAGHNSIGLKVFQHFSFERSKQSEAHYFPFVIATERVQQEKTVEPG